MNRLPVHRPAYCLLYIAVLLFTLSGCQKNPTAVQTPPPIRVANSLNVLAQATNAAVDALIAARDNGTISQADLTVGFSVCKVITAAVPKINAELTSTDTWEVQKPKVLKIIVDSGVEAVSRKLPTNARAIMAAALTAFNAISSELGGPIL